MEHMNVVSFSSLVAGMLLCEREIGSVSIVNMISNLYNNDIYIDDDDDDLSNLFLCVSVNANYTGFYLKEGLDYSSILYNDVTVYDYLVNQSNEIVLSFLGVNCDKVSEDRTSTINKKKGITDFYHKFFDMKSKVKRKNSRNIAGSFNKGIV